jgi:hypothetical protein
MGHQGPPLPLATTSVVKKTHGGITPPSSYYNQVFYKSKSQKGIMPFPLLPIVSIIVIEKHTQGAMLHLYVKK